MRIATGFHVDPSQVFVTAGGKGVMAYANLIEALGRIRARVEPVPEDSALRGAGRE